MPLANESAPALAALLADGACREATAAAREALAVDPPLALWSLVRAGQLGCPELKTLGALSDWLAANAASVLRWPEGAGATPADRDWTERYERLRWNSLTVANRASEFPGGSSLADEAFLLGLVHAADDWWQLDANRAAPLELAATRAALPCWLAAALDACTQPSLDAPGVVSCVVRARQSALDERPPPDREPVPTATGANAVAFSLPKFSAALARLAELRTDFDQRLETEKLEAMAEFAAGAGHEINNPLAVIAGRAQLLIADETNAERRRELAVMNTQAMRVFEMISDMMLFARPPKPQWATCDLTAVVDQVLAELAARIAERDTTLQRAGVQEAIELTADAVQLAVALRALLENALNAMGRGGTLTVEVHRQRQASGNSDDATVTIRDTGPGISADVRRHLFDPFYSGRRAGRGLGMGLPKCWRIVTNHGGTIDVESEAEQGATFTIRLPIHCNRTP